jgi:hypothetical protein
VTTTTSALPSRECGHLRRSRIPEPVRGNRLTEIREELADPAGDRGVPFDLAGPAAFDHVLGQLVFADEISSHSAL